MSAQLSLPGVKWPPQPRPPPRSPEKRLPRPIAPILGSPPAIKQQRGMCGRAREFVREIWKSATLNAAELYVVSCDVLFFQAPSLSPPCSFCSRIQIIAVIFVEALYEYSFRSGREWADLRYKVLQEEISAKFGEGYWLAGFDRVWARPCPTSPFAWRIAPAINNKTRLNSISYDRIASGNHAAAGGECSHSS